MSLVWDKFPEGGNELLTMLALSDYADDEGGNIFPSMEVIAKKLRIERRQAQRNVHKLIDDGFLVVVGNEFGGAKGTTRRYQINMIKLRQTGVMDDTGVISDTGVMDDTRRVSYMTQTGVVDDTQYVIKHQLNVNASLQASFEQFWIAYNKKKNRGDAERAWKRIKPNRELAALIIKKAAIEHSSHKDKQFQPYPASWLNAKGWLNETDHHGNVENLFEGAI